MSGLEQALRINTALRALVTKFAGPTAPTAAQLGIDSLAHVEWTDTSAIPHVIKVRDASDSFWIVTGAINGNMWIPYAYGAAITAAGAVLLSKGSAAEQRTALGIPLGTGTGEIPTADQIAGLSRMIGEPFAIFDHISGVTAPSNSGSVKYIKLTAGESGVGGYNNGMLTSESTTGSSPTITSTAVISLSGSPLGGQTVNLINTERRFLRAGSSGTLENGSVESHAHGLTQSLRGSGAYQFYFSAGTAGISGGTDAYGGVETRPRNIGVTYYMRIK